MKVQDLIQHSQYKIIVEGDLEKEISKPFCCDLLSIAMSKTPPQAAWVTVMSNINTLAVAELTDASCIIMAEGVPVEELVVQKAQTENITILQTDQPVFETAQQVWEILNEREALSYDLHIHSCLSPCGDDDMTPGNIVGMAMIKGLDVIAVTDHNSCKNCPAVMQLAESYGIIAIPGMELTTMEEVHVVCLFPTLEVTMAYDEEVYRRLIPIPNQIDIFGKQQICNCEDEVVGTVEYLLINATDISFDEVYSLTKKYHGMMIPAHIDKKANSLLANLGFVPPDSQFVCAEVKDLSMLADIQKTNPYINQCKIISDSDAHYLEHIHEPDHFIHVEERSIAGVLDALQTPTIHNPGCEEDKSIQ